MKWRTENMMTKFDKPHDFAYNADLKTLADSIVQLQEAVNKLEERATPKKRAPRKAKEA